MIEISERFLSDCGGWQALREARGLHEAGRVMDAAYEPPLLHGRVRTADSEVRAGLRIVSKSNVENLCTCRESRRDGKICAHSLAVGLAFLKPRSAPAEGLPPGKPPLAVAKTLPTFSTTEGVPLRLAVVLPPNFTSAWDKGTITVGFEAETPKGRVMLPALDPAATYQVESCDLAMVRRLPELFAGTLPGVGALDATTFLRLLAALRGHPRVTFGRGAAATVGEQGIILGVAPPETARILTAGAHAWLFDRNVFTQIESVAAPTGAAASSVPANIPTAFELKIEGSLRHLGAELTVRYGNRSFTLSSFEHGLNTVVERSAIDRLIRNGFTGPDRNGQFVLKGEPAILAFFARTLPQLRRDWKVEIGARFEHVTADVERIEPKLDIRSSGESWFELKYELGTKSGERFSASEIQRMLQSGQNSIRLKNRKLAVFDPALLDDFQQVLRDCDPQQQQPGVYRVATRHAAYLAETLQEQGAQVQADPAWRKFATAPESRLRPFDLGSLDEILRPYQKDGVYWLKWLADNSLSGILADEMGLGKTVQALALMRARSGPSLVVCPASLVFNWQREAAKFAPELGVRAIVGGDRAKLLVAPPKARDLLITSYPLLRRDAEHYRGIEFDTVILDEAQHIKNPDTQNAQAAYALHARHRFALTGTPVENSVRDLWSLMHFLMPGYLGTRDDFRERYEREIQNDPGGPAQLRLQRRLRPFILRRKKRDVIAELPDKIEQVSYCELSDAQRGLYSQLLHAARKQADDLNSAGNQGRARMMALTALLRLRQVCCDPRLITGQESQPPGESAKAALLDEILAEAIDGGHRVLIFSQFVAMLQILGTRMQEAGFDYCYLDGQTRDRAAQVDRFQRGETPIFLISLKAGGTGLNLTAADTVIHYDPWWNPAVEAQATDRAHRIGQRKVVTSYKLIARDTVEEKILSLQQRKRAILDAAVESEQPLMGELSTEELRELLA